MKGVYQHCGEKRLHRYLAEYDFRHSHRIANGYDDRQRSVRALKGIVGKRPTYEAWVRKPYVDNVSKAVRVRQLGREFQYVFRYSDSRK